AAAGNLQQLGAACGLGPLVDGAASAARALARPLPEPAGRISGGAMVFNDLVLGARGQGGGMPEKIDGVLLIASPDARGLFGKASELDPQIKSLGIDPDGKLHDLHLPMQLPFAVSAGVGDRLIVATAGNHARPLGDTLVGVRSGGKAPLFVASYEFGKLMELAQRSASLGPVAADPGFQAFMTGMTGVFGRVASTLDVTDHGLAFLGMVELK
ncbi:MAG TPA: hypothetical protein VHW23_26820, partial [Kofleriaceae bacterium]|nr:hypothetical protein [Kofleriaceae bacterium]